MIQCNEHDSPILLQSYEHKYKEISIGILSYSNYINKIFNLPFPIHPFAYQWSMMQITYGYLPIYYYFDTYTLHNKVNNMENPPITTTIHKR